MKINKLTIHNIASIENATIDFTKDPLSNTDLFLITGTTGSGKTTILDSICLALYNTTPRISKGGNNKLDVNTDRLKGKDPRNIMRSNTGYAFVQLHFTGNDGCDYIAEWSVQRGTNKVASQKLNNVVWSVTETSSGRVITGDKGETYAEVAAAIQSAVGLDYNQFCRTTMLAQGEFTEFLKSDDEGKAEILEKMSGTEIFRKIGQEIYNQYQEADKLYKAEKREHDAIVDMGPELRKQTEDRIAELAEKLQLEQDKIAKLELMIDWLGDQIRSEADIAKCKAEVDAAEKQVSTDEFVQRQNLVKEWNDTAEVRECHKNALAAMVRANEVNGKIEALEKEFGKALSGEAYLVAKQTGLAEKKSIAENFIAQNAANDKAYKMEQTICGNIGNLAAKESEIKSNTIKLNELIETVKPAAEETARTSSAKVKTLADKADKVKQELDKVSASLAEIDLQKLRKQKEGLNSAEILKANMDGYLAKIETSKKSIADQEAKLPEAQKVAKDQARELELLKAEHDIRHQSLEKATMKMRSMLQERLGAEDNVCPVCGQIVKSIKADEVFAEEYALIKAEYEAKVTLSNKAREELLSLNNCIQSEKKRLTEHGADLAKHMDEFSKLHVYESVKNCSKEEITVMIDEIAGKIKEGEKVEARRTEIQEEYTRLSKEHSNANAVAINDKNKITIIEQDIVRLKKAIESDNEDAAKISSMVSEALDGTITWSNDWRTAPSAFTEELKKRANDYNNAIREVAVASEQLAGIKPILANIASIKATVKASMPQWDPKETQSIYVPDIQDIWTKLSNNLEAYTMALREASNDYAKQMKNVNAFIEEHPAFTTEKLETLNRISVADKERISGENTELLSKRDTAKAQLESALERHKQLKLRKVEGIMDSATPEELNAQKANLVSERDKISEERGKLLEKIAADDEALAKKGDTTLLDQLADECEKWKGFNSHYGDKDGDKLSKIAQSYVLSSLLHTANHHLKSMAPRYKLLVTPGTLTLKLEDQDNMYATRNTNSISGGESFLVSLALALALADFGQNLGVSTLFIDEGFGTLSGNPLQAALNTLKAIHSDAGRQVGIISHREEIRASIPVHIMVNTQPGKSASTINVGIGLNNE